MLCRKPISVPVTRAYKNKPDKLARFQAEGISVIPIACGQCLACRINKRRQWTLRILLEYTQHAKSCFVSLTYAPENLPFSDESWKADRGVLCKKDLQLFLKRLRKHFDSKDGRKIRYYACGEYGPHNTHRPHYHLILFGVDADELDPDWFYFRGRSGPIRKNYIRPSLLYSLWNEYGTVHVGETTPHSIGYVAGYVTNKLTKEDDGYSPEFALMSRMPGLGLKAFSDIAQYLQKVSEYHLEVGAARQIRFDGNLWPTGRFLLSKLRRISDIQSSDTEFEASLIDSFRQSKLQGIDFLSYLVEQDDQRFRNLEARQKLFKPRGKI